MKRLQLAQLLSMIALCICFYKANAQPYYFRHYQVENGLSNNTVFSSVQDKNGFMWFGTKEGLNRYDGYHFKLFTTGSDDRSLYPDFVFTLYIDVKGVLWIGSQKGLYWFDEHNEKMVRFIDEVTDVSAITNDNKGNLWFISRMSVCIYNFADRHLQVFPADSFFHATTMCKTEDGNMWFAADNGLIEHYDSAANNFKAYNIFSHSPEPASRWVQKIKAAGNNRLYIGTTSQGLKEFDISTGAYKDVLTYNEDKTTVFVRDILNNGNGEYWFATESGIFIMQTATGKFINVKKRFQDPYSLTDNAIYTLCKDKEGSIWAGTYFGGVNYYPKQYASFKKYFPDNSGKTINGSSVREICEDKEGNLWIGTEDAGLNKLNKATGTITHFTPGEDKSNITYTNLHGLLVSGNNLWIGTFEHGIDIMDIHTGKVKKHYTAGPGKNELKSNFTLCLIQTQAGDIYLGTSNGAYKYNPVSDNFERVPGIPEHLFVASLWEDHNHVLWIGTHSNGGFWLNLQTNEWGHFQNEPDNKNSLTNNDINAVFEDSRYNIWFSTEGGGLCKLGVDRKTFTRYTVKNGLPSNFIFKALEDNQQNLWITTSKGLVNFSPGTEALKVYTRANGLLNDQFNYHSGYKDAEGNMYFGSVKGMISFRPASFSQPIFIPPVFITGFQVHNKELAINKDSSYLKQSIMYTDKIVLPYDQSSFSIDFAALSYISPEMTQYSYMMEGIDKEWTFLKSNRKVYFTNLSPGTYTFKLRAGLNGKFPKTEKELVVKIAPPIWATIYARLFYIIAFLALCYYLIRTYHNRIENKKEKEIYEAKINFFTIVAHEIRTPLTLIKGPVENLHEKIDELPEIKDDVITMERNTSRLVALVTQILDFRQTEKKGFSIDFTPVNLNDIIAEEYQSFAALAKKKSLLYTTELPPEPVIAMADEEGLHKIFSNLFSNAVKYAEHRVHLQMQPLNKDDSSITIEISNDGYIIPAEMKEKIFEPFYRLKETNRQKGTGIGLSLARSLAELHNGRLYLKESKNRLNTFVLELPLKPGDRLPAKNKKNKFLITTK
ncbi:MAG: two-component regulator propeller domain-containing protein [Chitinophagaceae bacterium]